jgi:hypothetical protein
MLGYDVYVAGVLAKLLTVCYFHLISVGMYALYIVANVYADWLMANTRM